MSARERDAGLRTSTRLISLIALVWFMAMYAMHTFWFEPMAGGRQAPDVMPYGYSLETFAAWREALGTEGRATFLAWHSHGLDMVFPFLLTIAFVTLLADLFGAFPRYRAMPFGLRILVPVLIAAPYGVADLMENAAVASMLDGTQAVEAANVAWASTLTAIKYAGVGLAFLVAGAFWLAARTTRRQARP